MTLSLKSLFLDGKMPFYAFLQKTIFFSSFVPLSGVFFFPENFRPLGTACWWLLIGILAVRPLGDIFIDFRILRALLPLRKELGVLCGSFGIAHTIGYFLNGKIALPDGFFLPEMWDFKTLFPWGMMGFAIAILLVLTSNIFAMKIFRSYWKRIHRLVYPFFFVVAIHIAFVQIGRGNAVFSSAVLDVFIPALCLFFLWGLSDFNFKISIFQKSEEQ
ncbi:MAG: ferric reductase-like transmembrane domain-containing protein [Candidatus Peregrinibacteria bacterium]